MKFSLQGLKRAIKKLTQAQDKREKSRDAANRSYGTEQKPKRDSGSNNNVPKPDKSNIKTISPDKAAALKALNPHAEVIATVDPDKTRLLGPAISSDDDSFQNLMSSSTSIPMPHQVQTGYEYQPLDDG